MKCSVCQQPAPRVDQPEAGFFVNCPKDGVQRAFQKYQPFTFTIR